MVRTFKPSDFRLKAEFGSIDTVENEYTGSDETVFVSKFFLHYKPHTRTLNQQYLAGQNGLLDTRVIVIRHNSKVSENMLVKIDGIVYTIELISPDENLGVNKYDYITIRKNNKVG